MATHREGTVIVSVTVDPTGAVKDAAVVESAGPDLDRAALDAVKGWVFRPATRNGAAIAARIRIPFRFSLAEVAAPAETSTAAAPKPSTGPARTATTAEPKPSELTIRARTPTAAAELEPETPAEKGVIDVTIAGRPRMRSHGASDFEIETPTLAAVPRKNATELLQLAPGILLTNEGGEGHAEQVFLRGFDAREGQDIEFTVDGVPVNDTGNLHGNGYADTHFIIPELVLSLRVVEGPFAPQQGNFAVAGSADYELGLDRRGVTSKFLTGSFGTNRLLLTWGPEGASRHTFAGVELYSTTGFGQNRAAKRGTAMGQYEGKLGESGTYRLTATAYATHFQTAGVLREDDYDAGRVAFFDSYDKTQGGDDTRFSISGDYATHIQDTDLHQLIFIVDRTMRLRENFTGFLLDIQEPFQSPHVQRGDLLDLHHDGLTLGGRGFARYKGELLGLSQELEVGYYAKGDTTHGTQYRIQAANDAPYHVDTDLDSRLADLGLYADANLHATSWLNFRGGLRADLFTFDVLNNCVVQGAVDFPSKTMLEVDKSCLDQQAHGAHREPVQRYSTASTAVMPRGTVLVGPFQHLTLSGSYGLGVRSIDPVYISQDFDTPFATVKAYEAGLSYTNDIDALRLVARAVFFRTRVDRELIFSQTEGRNTLAGGTLRNGALAALRASTSFFDESLNATIVRATIDESGLLIPYIPDLVVRSDTAVFHDLPFSIDGTAIRGTLGAGVTYVGPRALPYGERSSVIFVVDGSALLSWKEFELGVISTNLLANRYRLGEYNYASDFREVPGRQPTLVAARHFTAGAPQAFFVSFAINLGGP